MFSVFLQLPGLDVASLALSLAGFVVFFAVAFFVVNFLNERFSGPKQEKISTQVKKAVSVPSSFSEKPFEEKKQSSSSFGGASEKDQSIVNTIKELLKTATPEEEIVQNLRDLGLDDKSARKMVLLAESDALEVFKDEIDKITKKNVEQQLEKIQSQLIPTPGKSYAQTVNDVEKKLSKRLEQAELATNKPKKMLARDLVDLGFALEELKLPELSKKPVLEPQKDSFDENQDNQS